MVNPRIDRNNVFIENCSDEKIKLTNCDELGNVIKSQFDLYNDKKLIFRNCPNLKEITADCLNLTGLEIENCPKLEKLSAYHNKIEKVDLGGLNNLEIVDLSNGVLKTLDLTGCENLQELYVSNNELQDLDLTDNKWLKILYCSFNKLKKLNINHLDKNLKTLHCEVNFLTSLDCSGLEKLEYLYCFCNCYSLGFGLNTYSFGLKKLILNNCKSLKELDCGECVIRTFELINHPNLEILSCKTNLLKKLVIEKCFKLQSLDFSSQGARVWDENRGMAVLFEGGECSTILNIDESSRSNLKKINYNSNGACFCDLEDKILDYKDFPKLEEFGIGTNDDPSFEEWIREKRQKEREQKYFSNPHPTPSTSPPNPNNLNNTFPAENFKEPAKKDQKIFFDFSGMRMSGKLTIDNWPELKVLNVGDNFLTGLVIKNCPELVCVIYSHNHSEIEVIIEDCPSLETQFSYSSGNKLPSEPTQEEQAHIDEQLAREQREDEGYESDEDNSEKNTETLLSFLNNPQATAEELVTLKLTGVDNSLKDKLLILAEKLLSPLAYDELVKLNIKNIPSQLAPTFAKLFTVKFKEKQEQEAVLKFINNPNATIRELLKLNLKNIDVSLRVKFLKFAEKLLSELNLKQLKLTLGKLKEVKTNDNHQLLARIIIKLIRKKFKEQFPELCEFEEKKSLKTKAAINLAITQLKVNKENYSKKKYQEVLISLEKQCSELKKKENLSSQNSQRDDSVISPYHLIYCIILAFVVVLAIVYRQNKKNKS